MRELGADLAAVRAALEQREQSRGQAAGERAAAAGDEVEAASILAAGDGAGDEDSCRSGGATIRPSGRTCATASAAVA